MGISKIPQSELIVMKVIWNNEKSLSSKEIINILKEQTGWKRTTTLTLLSKLVKKEFIKAEKIKLYTYYTPIITKNEYLELETEYFFTNIHDRSLKSLITALHENAEISENDLEDLEKWIKEKKQ